MATSKSTEDGLVNLIVGIPILLLFLWGMYGNNGGGGDTAMKAEFRTLEACLTSLHAETGERLTPTIDDPDMVSGHLSNGEMWWCKKCESGTKGTYWEARYK